MQQDNVVQLLQLCLPVKHETQGSLWCPVCGLLLTISCILDFSTVNFTLARLRLQSLF